MKGDGSIFALLSIFGILLGIFLVFRGWGGDGLGSISVFVIGIFIVIKEVLDLMHAGG